MYKRLLFACLGAAAFSADAWADKARVHFTLLSDTPAQVDVPFESLFYSRPAVFEQMVRLTEPYREQVGDVIGEIPAGSLLYETRTDKTVYYCSSHSLRAVTKRDLLGAIFRAPIAQFGVIRAADSDIYQQCFRDTDGDGRFDEKTSSTVIAGTVATVADIVDAKPISPSLSYDKIDKAEPVLEIGLKGRVRNANSGRFGITVCMKTKKTEFTTEGEDCFLHREGGFLRSDLPTKIDFLDGEITVHSVTQAPGGVWNIQYSVSRPPMAPFFLKKLLQYPATILYELQLASPDRQ